MFFIFEFRVYNYPEDLNVVFRADGFFFDSKGLL